eukprot:10275403-Alexandrium_andersonii.AAC.1
MSASLVGSEMCIRDRPFPLQDGSADAVQMEGHEPAWNGVCKLMHQSDVQLPQQLVRWAFRLPFGCNRAPVRLQK